MTSPDPVRDQTDAVLAVIHEVLGSSVVGAYRYGSAVEGGLRPESDLDLFVLAARPTTDGQKRRLIEAISPLSRRRDRPPDWRPVELTVVVAADVRPWRWPPRFDFQYGEWLRAEFDAGRLAPWPPLNPDVAVLLTMVRQRSEPLVGPPAVEVLDPVPRADLVRAMVDEMDTLFADLVPDTRNVLLTLARMWSTVATGEFRSKDAAAEWAAARLPEADGAVLRRARDGYLSGGDEGWGALMPAACATAERLAAEVRALAASG
ncbi:MAG TPA: aminoglycoside adenylyltransferase family protein [Candidatus Limnocylindria bacterium]